jgi:hypothetical protein
LTTGPGLNVVEYNFSLSLGQSHGIVRVVDVETVFNWNEMEIISGELKMYLLKEISSWTHTARFGHIEKTILAHNLYQKCRYRPIIPYTVCFVGRLSPLHLFICTMGRKQSHIGISENENDGHLQDTNK